MANKTNSKGRNRRRPVKKVEGQEIKLVESTKNVKIPTNDPEWYIYDRDMFDGVISMPTLEFKGKKVPWNDNFGFTNDSTAPSQIKRLKNIPDVPLSTPTVACYFMNPGLEKSWITAATPVGDYTAINVAARKMYAELSASNAKTSLYAPQDIATLILALGQVIAMTTHLKRMYGIANYYNFYSRGVPSEIFYAMKVQSFDQLKSNLANYRNQVNQLISKIDTILFPSGLSYFKKCEYIYQNIFVDRDEKMVTYHFMAPESTWTIDEMAYDQGTILKTTSVVDNHWSTLITKVETMVERILTSSTFNYIFADILNLANRNVLNAEPINIELIPIDYVTNPIYSEQFNWQIMNMSILPMGNLTEFRPDLTMGGTPNNDVYPDVNRSILLYKPIATGQNVNGALAHAKYAKQVPVRLPDTNPTQDLFVELLAYYAIPEVYISTSGNTVSSRVTYAGLPDFWCSGSRIVRPGDGDAPISVSSNLFSNGLSTSDWYTFCNASQFVHFPFTYLIDIEGSSETSWAIPLSRMSAYTQVTKSALNNLRYETYLGLLSFKK